MAVSSRRPTVYAIIDRLPKCAGLALVVAAVAACSGNTLQPCQPGVTPVFAMVDPSPGATSVPDNLSQIVFIGFGPSSVTLTGGTQTIALTLVPAPTPTPTPQDGVPYKIATISTPLLANTTYSVSFPYSISGSNCAMQSGTATVGSFTTK